MLSTHKPPFSLLKCPPPLGLDHEHLSAAASAKYTDSIISYQDSKRTEFHVARAPTPDSPVTLHCWKIFHSVEPLACLSLLTEVKIAQVLIADKV